MTGFRQYRPAERRGPGIASPLEIVEGFLNTDLEAATDPLTGATLATGTLIAWQQDEPTDGENQGEWDAETNDPPLVSSVGTDGHYYRISVTGATLLDEWTYWPAGQYVKYESGTWRLQAPVFFEVDPVTDLGEWNANTNDPSLTSSIGDELDFYHVSESGTTLLDGISDWTIGEHLQFKDGVWVRRGARQVVLLINRDTGLSGNADYYFQAAKINGEFRVMWLSCSTVRQ